MDQQGVRPRDWPKVMLRVPPELKGALTREAKRNGSSQNSEIVRCIRERMDRISTTEIPTTVAKRTA